MWTDKRYHDPSYQLGTPMPPDYDPPFAIDHRDHTHGYTQQFDQQFNRPFYPEHSHRDHSRDYYCQKTEYPRPCPTCGYCDNQPTNQPTKEPICQS